VKHTNDTGGLLGRRVDLLVEDDQSQPTVAVGIYERLITREKVDAILGPYSSRITDPVADVSEKYRMPMIAPMAATSSIFKKGRRFVFMTNPPAERYLAGLIDMATDMGLRTVALISEDTLFPKAIASGASQLARTRGLRVVLAEEFPKGTRDFSAILSRIRDADADVLGMATYFEDTVAITRRLRELAVNPRMYGVVHGHLEKFYERLGHDAEFVYGATQWERELVMLRAGGLIPVARHYPGAREFVEAYGKQFPGADLAYQAVVAYAGCQILVEAVKRAGSMDGEKIRAEILKLDLNTVYGRFKVDQDGFQVAKKMLMFQWQDGKKAIVWPYELAPSKPRFPTPPWSHR
jgi:branched-chain amino acid transport system substrate-binding protein